MLDLFGLEQQSTQSNDHPSAARLRSGFVRFGFEGCPDVLGQPKDGSLVDVEVKATSGCLRPEQAVFLERMGGACGLAFVARDVCEVLRQLGAQ